jgi:hypothetical protein
VTAQLQLNKYIKTLDNTIEQVAHYKIGIVCREHRNVVKILRTIRILLAQEPVRPINKHVFLCGYLEGNSNVW